MKKISRITFFSLAVVMLSSCSFKVNKDDGKRDPVPPDFGKKGTVVLAVMSGKDSYDKYLEKNFKENYSGAYKLVTKQELSSPVYKDIAVYQYVFGRKLEQEYSPSDGSGSKYQTVSRFYVEDRASGLKYETKIASSWFSKLMIKYSKELDEVYRLNQ